MDTAQNHAPPAVTQTRLELQYCERCGALWLRPAAQPNLCTRCVARDSATPHRPSVNRKPYHPRRKS